MAKNKDSDRLRVSRTQVKMREDKNVCVRRERVAASTFKIQQRGVIGLVVWGDVGHLLR